MRKKIEFYKGKSKCKGIVIAVWDLGKSLCAVSGGKAHKSFWLFNVITSIKQLTIALKKLYSWPRKLYQCITNLFFLASIPTPGRVRCQVENNLTSSWIRSWSTGIRERYLPLLYYICIEVHVNKARKNKSAVSYTYRRKKHNFASIYFFSFKIKRQDLVVWECKKSKRSLSVVCCNFYTDLWPSTLFSRGFIDKLSDTCDTD